MNVLTNVLTPCNDSHMNTNEALIAAVAHRTELVKVAESLTGRKATVAWKAVEQADWAVNFAAADVEREQRMSA